MKTWAKCVICSIGALPAVAATLSTKRAQDSEMEHFIGCPRSGLYKNGTRPVGRELALNLQKNRSASPSLFSSVSLNDMARPGDDRKRWDPAQNIGVRVTGYVALIIQNPFGEVCNCNKLDDSHSDTHIDLVLRKEDAPDFGRHVIIEVTPRIKYLARRRGLDWSTQGLARQFYRHWIVAEGWLLYDWGHEKQARNTNPKHLDKVWRATCWEVHPVTDIKLLPAPSSAAPEPPGSRQRRS